VNTVTHIAGPAITACGRVVQRCSLCGEKLVDSKGCAMPIQEDGTPDTIGTWEVGRLVQVSVDCNPTSYVLLPDTDRLPDDSCLELIED
jgi:hypothetical protein